MGSLTAPAPPRVSVCVPAYNTARWIVRAVESALGQTFGDLEVVVVDDASTDGTLARLRELDDPRIRLFANSRNLGASGNWNRSLSLARGRLIKFLHGDDVMYPDCLEAMVDVFERHPGIGLVFALRDVESDVPHDPAAERWQAKYEDAHATFGDLREVNPGKALARRWLQSGLGLNAIGEPTNVMVSRDCLERVGTFSLRIRQRLDMDLWLRAMLAYDVGFVGRPLSRYLIRSDSLTSVNRAGALGWMDSLWLSEGLLTFARWPEIRALRRKAAKRCVRYAVRSAIGGDWSKVAALAEYVRFRITAREPRRLFGALEDRGPPGETVPEPTRALR